MVLVWLWIITDIVCNYLGAWRSGTSILEKSNQALELAVQWNGVVGCVTKSYCFAESFFLQGSLCTVLFVKPPCACQEWQHAVSPWFPCLLQVREIHVLFKESGVCTFTDVCSNGEDLVLYISTLDKYCLL